ncbi:MAG: hypothetical protein KDA51_06500 [Planctomycetales bacterium]|nr:hypothetical protein [Planctomycetales bacterium]
MTTRLSLLCLLGSLHCWWLAPIALAQIPTMELHSLSQSIAQIGSTVDMQITGSSVEELARLHFVSPHVSSQPVLEPALPLGDPPLGNGTFKVQIAAEASPGKCEVRAMGRFGISNPRPLWLTRKAVVVAATDHSESALAIEYPQESIVLARCLPQRRNYYRMELEAGQRLKLAVIAKQLDSRANPIVVLYGPAPERRELARSRMIDNWPAELEYVAEQAGEVLVVVYDAIYGGGADYSYALECVIDANTSPENQVASTLELDAMLRPTLSNATNAVQDVERWTMVGEQIREADNPTQSGTGETLPLRVEGVLCDEQAANSHDFTATKDQPLWLEVDSQRLGQLTDPRLILYRLTTTAEITGENQTPAESSQQLLEFDDPPAVGDAGLKVVLRDPQLNWIAPEDGRYRIELLDNESGPRRPEECDYWLRVESSVPSAQLLAYPPYPINNPALSHPTGLNLMRGGACSLRVLALRRGGMSGPIEIEVTGLPEGVSCTSTVIHPSQSEVSLTLQCSETAARWVGPIQIVGRTAASETASVAAQPATISWAAIPTRNTVQSRLCDELLLYVNSDDTAAITAQLGDGQTLEVKQGDKLSLPIALTRRAGGAAACVLRAQNVVAKVGLPEVTIAADQSTGAAELTVAEDAPLGEFTCWMQCETKIKWRDNPQALERAEAHLKRLNDALAQATEEPEKKSLQTAIEGVTARIATLKTTSAEKELTVWLPSTTQRVRIVGK